MIHKSSGNGKKKSTLIVATTTTMLERGIFFMLYVNNLKALPSTTQISSTIIQRVLWPISNKVLH